MHTYTPGGGTSAVAGFNSRRFTCARRRRRARDARPAHRLCPVARDLAPRRGRAMTCCLRGCTCDSLVGWARDPSSLRECREEGLDIGRCGSDWVIVESRPRGGGAPRVSQLDVEAFMLLRTELHDVGVRLVDALVFDNHGHRWSLRELADGTTTWASQPGKYGNRDSRETQFSGGCLGVRTRPREPELLVGTCSRRRGRRCHGARGTRGPLERHR